MGATKALVSELLKGAIDTHVHFSPNPVEEKRLDAPEAVKYAQEVGMRAIVLKCGYIPSPGIAYLMSKQFTGIQIFGAVVLNKWVGGMNPAMVRMAHKYGDGTPGKYMRIVWMPTTTSENQMKLTKRPISDGVPIIRNGELLPQTGEVLDAVAELKVALATGHIAPEESLLLIDEAKARGIEKIIVTHVESGTVAASVDQQKEMGKKGAYVEHIIASSLPYAYHGTGGTKIKREPTPLSRVADNIRAVGANQCIMASDCGYDPGLSPPPSEAMRVFIGAMLDLDISPQDVEVMLKKNPAKLIGLE